AAALHARRGEEARPPLDAHQDRPLAPGAQREHLARAEPEHVTQPHAVRAELGRDLELDRREHGAQAVAEAGARRLALAAHARLEAMAERIERRVRQAEPEPGGGVVRPGAPPQNTWTSVETSAGVATSRPCPRSGGMRKTPRPTGCGRRAVTRANLRSSRPRTSRAGTWPRSAPSEVRSPRTKRSTTSSRPGSRPRRLRSWLVRSSRCTPLAVARPPPGMAPSR